VPAFGSSAPGFGGGSLPVFGGQSAPAFGQQSAPAGNTFQFGGAPAATPPAGPFGSAPAPAFAFGGNPNPAPAVPGGERAFGGVPPPVFGGASMGMGQAESSVPARRTLKAKRTRK